MRVLYVVQRYGEGIVGGAEAAARQFAEHLVEAGHDVSVLTSCATSYVDWADVYDEGTTELNGVTVNRLRVSEGRRPERFGPLHEWMIRGPRPTPLFVQHRWAKHMGPDLLGLRAWISDNIDAYDVAIFMTYLYKSTTAGLPMAAGRIPTILQPTAHEELPIWVRLYDTLFRQPDAFLFFTDEERQFVRRRFGIEPVGETVGIGIDLDRASEVERFRARIGIGDAPYLLYLGRIDATKGAVEAVDFFIAYKRRNPGPLRLMLVGEQVQRTTDDPEVCYAGFFDEAQKQTALAGSVALIQPSRFESFSIVVCESWVQGRPALVHADSEVLVGQAKRSQGALPYRGFAEFEAAVNLLVDNPALASSLGLNGRRYVERTYRWDRVLAGFERCFNLANQAFAQR